MSGDLNAAEKVVEEVLIDLIEERMMSPGVQASLTQGVQASSSTSPRSEPSCIADDKRTKHRDDLANVKLIPSVLLDYIPPLASAVNRDSVPRDFDYTLIMACLQKGICVVRP
jgi:hypothetical protein